MKASDCPACIAWAQYQGDLPEDWGDCKCVKQKQLTLSDIPQQLKDQIAAEALEEFADQHELCEPHNWHFHIRKRAAKLRNGGE
jgi:hypothetical protein